MKGEINTNHTKIMSEHNRLNHEIISIKKQLQQLPPGKLICAKNGKYSKWYQSNGHTKTLIPKNNRKLAEELAIKKYLLLKLEDLENELKASNAYLKHKPTSGKANQLLLEASEYQKLLSPYFTPLSDELSNWQNTPYETNSYHSEQLIHQCVSGIKVRSKSEVMIETVLSKHKIPFRYECALHLEGITFFPDFTIRHPKNGEYFYWEHFGLMDHNDYANNAFKKMQIYTMYGIIPSIHLITTYETKEYPLLMSNIEKIVEHYFL